MIYYKIQKNMKYSVFWNYISDSYVEFRKNILKLSTIDIKIDEFLSSVILKNNIETFENIHKDFSTLDMFSKLLKQILTGNINSNVISTVSIF